MKHTTYFAIALVMTMLFAWNAAASSFVIELGDGQDVAVTSTTPMLASDESLADITIASFGQGVGISKTSSVQAKRGSGSLDEHHWASNLEGDWARVDASLKGSSSWVYSYSISTGERSVYARENVVVANGKGLDLRGTSGNKRGDTAEVRALGSDEPVSLTYKNSASATLNSASAEQTVIGISLPNNPVDGIEPLKLESLAKKASSIGSSPLAYDQYAKAWGSLLGTKLASSTASASSSAHGASASLKLSAPRSFHWAAAGGSAGKGAVSGSELSDKFSAVSAGAIDGKGFTSSIEAKQGLISEASQSVNTKGNWAYKSSLAGKTHYDVDDEIYWPQSGFTKKAMSYTSVFSGSLNSKDRAEAKEGSAKISEVLSTKGSTYRMAEASCNWLGDGSWREVRTEFGSGGAVSGSSEAVSGGDRSDIKGKWLIAPRGGFAATCSADSTIDGETSGLGVNIDGFGGRYTETLYATADGYGVI